MLRLSTFLALLLSLPASAQTVNCAAREQVVERLTSLGEQQSALGLSSKGQVFEIWASQTTGTWTIVLSQTTGLSCIMSYGAGWTGLVEVRVEGQPA